MSMRSDQLLQLISIKKINLWINKTKKEIEEYKTATQNLGEENQIEDEEEFVDKEYKTVDENVEQRDKTED